MAYRCIKQSLWAWLKSSLISVAMGGLLLPYLVYRNTFDNSTHAALFFIGIYSGTYFAGLVIIGIPVFLKFWPQPDHYIWRLRYGIPFSFAIGYFDPLFLYLLFSLFFLSRFSGGIFLGCGISGIFSVFTGIVAYVFHRLRLKR